MIVRLLGEAAARLSGFHEALTREDAGRPGAVLEWARMPETPSTVRALVELAYADGAQDAGFDEVEIARATGPEEASQEPGDVRLFARRRSGAIYYRLAGTPAGAPPPPTAAPLDADTAHGLVCGAPGSIVALGVGRLLGMLDPKQKSAAETLVVVAGDDWMPRATSPFHDFKEIEEGIRRAVIDQVLAHCGFAPLTDEHR